MKRNSTEQNSIEQSGGVRNAGGGQSIGRNPSRGSDGRHVYAEPSQRGQGGCPDFADRPGTPEPLYLRPEDQGPDGMVYSHAELKAAESLRRGRAADQRRRRPGDWLCFIVPGLLFLLCLGLALKTWLVSREHILLRTEDGGARSVSDTDYKRWQAFELDIKPLFSLEKKSSTCWEFFPADYIEPLKRLALIYPAWTFEAVHIETPWPEVLAAELNPENKNLVQYDRGEFFEDYAWMVKHTERSYDGKNWYAANEKAVAYFLDPRNFLNLRDIFQFTDLTSPVASSHEAGVRAIFGNNEDLAELTPLLLQAAEEAGIMPEAAAVRMKAEISSKTGITLATRGLLDPDCPPLETGSPSPSLLSFEEQKALLERLAAEKGEANLSEELKTALQKARTGVRPFAEPKHRYYNFFNIGAYPDPSNVNGAAVNAARFAAGYFTEDRPEKQARLLLPWTDPLTALKGGALFLKTEYYANGQNTPYFQKFDVFSGTFSHQYMQAVFGAREEGRRLYKVWAGTSQLSEPYHFRIPVYKGMPPAAEGK